MSSGMVGVEELVRDGEQLMKWVKTFFSCLLIEVMQSTAMNLIYLLGSFSMPYFFSEKVLIMLKTCISRCRQPSSTNW